MQDNSLRANLHNLFREKLYNNLNDKLKSVEPNLGEVSKFYRAIYFIVTNKPQDGWNLFDSLKNDPSMNLASLLAQVYIQKNFDVKTEESVAQLEATLRNERKKASEKSLYYASVLLHLTNRQEKAREYLEKLLTLNPNLRNADGLILRGWVELSSHEPSKKKNPLDYLSLVLEADNTSAEAHLGKVKALIQADINVEALTAVNTAISLFPNNPEFVLEKVRVHLAAKDWDAVSEVTKKAMSFHNPLTAKVLEIQILATICHDGSFVDAVPLMKNLYTLLEKSEPTNGDIFVNAAQLFSRVCGRHIPILHECQLFVEKALRIDDKNINYLVESANQQILQGLHKEALNTLKAIAQLGHNSVEVIVLKVHCLLNDDQYDSARQQLSMLEELNDTKSSYPELLFAKAMLLRQSSPNEALQLLRQAYQNQIKNSSWLPYSVDYLTELNPDFLLSIAEEYFQHHAAEETPSILTELSGILTCVVEACPGLLPALYRLANVNFILGDYRPASSTLHHIIDHVDPTCIDAYLLMAQIGLEQSNLAQASQYLEMGLSYNFQIRDHPRYVRMKVANFLHYDKSFSYRYHLLLARIHRQRKENDAALSSIRTAMILSGMRPSSAGTKRSKFPFTVSEKASVYLELFHVLSSCGQKEEAGQVIQEAVHELQGTSQEGLIILAEVLVMMWRKRNAQYNPFQFP